MRSNAKHIPLTVLVLGLLATASAEAACVDLPDKLLMLASKGASVQIVDLNQAPVVQIKLDWALAAKDWGKLALTRHVCADAGLPNPNGGQCKIIGLTPGGQPMSAGGFESVIRRNLTD